MILPNGLTRREALLAPVTAAAGPALARASAAGVNVRALGAKGDGIADDTEALNRAVEIAVQTNSFVQIPPGVYRGWIAVRIDGVDIRGAGADQCRIKLPDGATHALIQDRGPRRLTGVPCVIQFGDIGAGNFAEARRGGRISGLTLDGNAARTPPPNIDLFGWGLAFTRYADVSYHDVRIVDCHAGGLGVFIGSDNHEGEVRVHNCGHALGHPGLDINSSRDGQWRFVSDGCDYGGRLLDNCHRNHLEGRIFGAKRSGFVYDNQPVNASSNNQVQLDIEGGCADFGVLVARNCSSSRISARVRWVLGVGVHELGRTENGGGSSGNNFQVSTQGCGAQSAIITGSEGRWAISSVDDGRRGPVYAVDVYGKRNILEVAVSDQRHRHTRGVAFREGSEGNVLRRYSHSGVVDPILDRGTGNLRG